MRTVTVTGALRAAPEDVFDFLVDNRNDELWCPMASDVELVEGEPGVGAVYRYQQAQGPGRPPLDAWLRTCVAERPHRLEWDNADRGLPYRATITLAAHGDGTRLTHTNRVELGSPLQQATWFAIAQVVLRVQLRNLRRELDR